MEDEQKGIKRISEKLKADSTPLQKETGNIIKVDFGSATNVSGNIIGNGITIYNEPPPIKIKTVVKTGDGVISAEQKNTIRNLIEEWARLREIGRRSSTNYATLWRSLGKHCKVNSYHEIKSDQFQKAVSFLYRQIAILNSGKAVKSKDPNWRKNCYKSIFSRAKNFDGGEDRMRAYVLKKFNTSDIKELSDDQLEIVKAHVFRWKKLAH